mgnify:CR=1 FL=1
MPWKLLTALPNCFLWVMYGIAESKAPDDIETPLISKVALAGSIEQKLTLTEP